MKIELLSTLHRLGYPNACGQPLGGGACLGGGWGLGLAFGVIEGNWSRFGTGGGGLGVRASMYDGGGLMPRRVSDTGGPVPASGGGAYSAIRALLDTPENVSVDAETSVTHGKGGAHIRLSAGPHTDHLSGIGR